MNKRTIQIDVIGPIEETELMKCKLYVDGRVCVIGMSLYDYEELMREKVFIRDGTRGDSPGCGSILIAFGENNAEILKNCDIAGKYVRIN